MFGSTGSFPVVETDAVPAYHPVLLSHKPLALEQRCKVMRPFRLCPGHGVRQNALDGLSWPSQGSVFVAVWLLVCLNDLESSASRVESCGRASLVQPYPKSKGTEALMTVRNQLDLKEESLASEKHMTSSFNVHSSCWHGWDNLSGTGKPVSFTRFHCVLWLGFYGWIPFITPTRLCWILFVCHCQRCRLHDINHDTCFNEASHHNPKGQALKKPKPCMICQLMIWNPQLRCKRGYPKNAAEGRAKRNKDLIGEKQW